MKNLYLNQENITEIPYIMNNFNENRKKFLNLKKGRISACISTVYATLFVALLMLAPAKNAWGQTEVTIGTGASQHYDPFPGWYGWNYDVCLYDAADIGIGGTIQSIAYDVSSANATTGGTLQVYMKAVPTNTTLAAATTFATYISGATLVYTDNAFSATATGWKTLTLSTPYNLPAGQSLLVMVKGIGCGTSGGCAKQCRYTTATDKHWYKRQDSSDPGQSATGTIDANRSNIKLVIGSCTPKFTSSGDHITNFTLGTINNTTTYTANNYSNYTNLSTTLMPGSSYNVSLTSSSGSGTHGAAIWIDFNDNGAFEASERVGLFDGIGASVTVTIPITIPASAPSGSHTLRVIYQWNVTAENLDPCASASFGEGEDYTVIIPSCTPPTVSFPQSSYSHTIGSGSFTAPTLTNNGGTATYTSSNTAVATVNFSTGAITIVGEGSTTITANTASTSTYCAGSASYTLNVVCPTMVAPTTTGASRCGAGIAELSASPGTNGNTCRWYNFATNGTLLNEGTTYNVNHATTTTYYVSTFNSTTNCESSTRTPVTITIYPSTITITPSASLMTAGQTYTLTATGSANYQWTDNYGNTYSGSSINITALPGAVFTVTGQANGCDATGTYSVQTVDNTDATCNVIYVSPSGNDTHSGSSTQPVKTLEKALQLAGTPTAANPVHIRMASGTYNVDKAVYLKSNIIVDGQWTANTSSGVWTKGTTETIINRTATTVEGTTAAPRIVALEANNIQNFTLQDLKVTTAAAPSLPAGESITYTPAPGATPSFYQGFETTNAVTAYATAGVVPTSWYSYVNGTNGNIVAPQVVTGDGQYIYVANGNNSLHMEAGSGGDKAYAVMPAQSSYTGKTLTFYSKMESSSSGVLKVGYVTAQTSTACASIVELATIPSTSGDFMFHSVNLNTVPANRYICFYWNYSSSWYACCIDDVSIYNTADLTGGIVNASNYGVSTYALHIANSSGYSLERCKFQAGNASAGKQPSQPPQAASGAAGSGLSGGGSGGTATNGAGNGGAGGNGGAYYGSSSGNAYSGSQSSAGSAASVGGASGGGAQTSVGSGASNGNCNASSLAGSAGTSGKPGSNGSNASQTAVNSATYYSYFTPSLQGAQGNPGGGGSGGSGGGGGRSRRPTFLGSCSDNGGNGGKGGGGGAGGIGGYGGYGGGSAFGVYEYNSTGTTTNNTLSAGTAGSGGSGGTGGTGGNGGSGASGGTATSGNGGAGGAGGKGGNGGTGQPGYAGVTSRYTKVQTNGTYTNNAVASATPNTYISSIDYGFSSKTGCTNSQIEITKSGGTWQTAVTNNFIKDKTPTTSTYNASYGNVIVSFDNKGNYTPVSAGSQVFITQERSLGNIIGDDICQGNSAEFSYSGTLENGDILLWKLYDDSENLLKQYGTQFNGSNNNFIFETWDIIEGTNFFIKLEITNKCCGLSKPIWKAVSMYPYFDPGEIVTGNETICSGGDPAEIPSNSAASGGNGNITYEWRANGTPISGSNSATYNPPTGLTETTTYTRWAKDALCNTDFIYSNGEWKVIVTAPPNAGTLSGNQDICLGGTTTFTTNGNSGGSWSSSNTSIATVNSSTGLITGVSAGTATITYTVAGTGGCSNATATRTVTVTAPPNAGTLSGNQDVCLGGTTTFTVSGNSATGSWTSSNTAVATVNSSGLVTSVAAGTATITYTVIGTGGCSDATATRTVTVTTPPNAGTLSGTQAICANGTTTFTSDGNSGGSWSSSNTAIATVNSSGLVTGVSAGTATITYTVTGTGGCDDATATRDVTVNPQSIAGTISATPIGNICAGTTAELTLSENTGTTIQWQINESGSWVDIAGATATQYTTPNLVENTSYRVVVTSGVCASVTSAQHTATVEFPNIPSISGNDYVWTGASNQNWNGTTNTNWLIFDNGEYYIPTNPPTETSNVHIKATPNCFTIAPTVSTVGQAKCNNITIESGNSLIVSENGLLKINGTMLNNGSLSMNENSNIEVKGNWTNNGTFTAGLGTVTFKGTGLQTITSGGSPFNNIVFNNTNGFNLSQATTIGGNATFTDGIVNFAGGSLSFSEGSSSNGGAAASYVNGLVSKTGTNAFTFPVGEGEIWAPIGIAAPSSLSTITAQYNFSTPPSINPMCNTSELHHVSTVEHWLLTSNNINENPAVTLYWKDGERSGITSLSDLRVAHWDNNCWENKGFTDLTGDVSAGSITSLKPFTSYSPVGFGSAADINPLPVELINFTATCNEGIVNLNWTTATEINNDHFELERSRDGLTWVKFAEIQGAGNSNIKNNYEYEDVHPGNGDIYYRLLQVDYDGTSEYSDIVHTYCVEPVSVPVISVYPNPFKDIFTLQIDNWDMNELEFEVSDLLGQKLLVRKFQNVDNQFITNINLSDIAPAMYILKIKTSDGVVVRKIERK